MCGEPRHFPHGASAAFASTTIRDCYVPTYVNPVKRSQVLAVERRSSSRVDTKLDRAYHAATCMQTYVRRCLSWRAVMRLRAMTYIHSQAAVLQARARGLAVRVRYNLWNSKAIVLHAWARGLIARIAARQRREAGDVIRHRLHELMPMLRVAHQYRLWRTSACCIQAVVRGRATRRLVTLLLDLTGTRSLRHSLVATVVATKPLAQRFLILARENESVGLA